MATSFHRNARCPHIGLKEGGEDVMLTGGLLPFPRTGCVLYAKQFYRIAPRFATPWGMPWDVAARMAGSTAYAATSSGGRRRDLRAEAMSSCMPTVCTKLTSR